MVFSFREFAFGTVHRVKGVHRKLFNIAPDALLKKINSVNVGTALDRQSQKPRVCHLCGYFLAELTTEDGWQLTGCSATELQNLLRAHALLKTSSQQGCRLR
jgi:hypothetical protein